MGELGTFWTEREWLSRVQKSELPEAGLCLLAKHPNWVEE